MATERLGVAGMRVGNKQFLGRRRRSLRQKVRPKRKKKGTRR
jgi:hypothetical protein